MCRNCQSTYAASFSPASMAITNPELIWSQVQEQKQRSAAAAPSQPTAQPLGTSPSSDAASTYSGSTAFSCDKVGQGAASKPKKSMRQRIKDVWGDRAGQQPPAARDDRERGASAKAGSDTARGAP